MGRKPRKRIWVQHVAVESDVLDTRVKACRARGLDASQVAVADGIDEHLRRAREAAFREDPVPGRLANWWRGTLVEASYRHMHAAHAQLVDLYDENELRAEIPVAVARAQATLHREDPRQISVDELRAEPPEVLRPRLRRLMDDSFAASDSQHAQLRSFRNIVLLAAMLIALLVTVTVVVVSQRPTVMPLCFPNEVVTSTQPVEESRVEGQNCPTRSDTDGPSGGDILIVVLLGALGGALAASVSIRNLKGTSTPYDVPVALSMLKVPLGGFTAVLALVAIQGDFIPGLTVLDSQEQILAYALIFGFAQQVLTRLLDQRAQTLLEGLPGKDANSKPPVPPAPKPVPEGATPGAGQAAGADPAATVPGPRGEPGAAEPAAEAEEDEEEPEPEYQPNPLGDEEDQVQDDETPTLADAPEPDHR